MTCARCRRSHDHTSRKKLLTEDYSITCTLQTRAGDALVHRTFLPRTSLLRAVLIMFLSKDRVDDLPGGLLDGLVRRVHDLPAAVFAGEVPDILDLGKNVLQIAVARPEARVLLAHLPDLLEHLGVDV